MTLPSVNPPSVDAPSSSTPPGNAPSFNVEHLLTQIIGRGASDLHLKTGAPPMARVKGEITRFGEVPLSAEQVQAVFEHVTSPAGRVALEEHGEADFAYTLRGVGRLRVNVYQQQSGLALVMRYIRNDVPNFRALNLPERVMTHLAEQHQGIILVTGPTGSGKTTTLASLIQLINETKAANIITVEDPIEVVYQDSRSTISQRELGRDTKTFARALRAALRQDPDIILIGEMRDKETVEAAISAAQTGHLVLSTLHTQDAVRTINRILDFFAPHERPQIRMALSESMVCIMSHRLVVSGGRGAIRRRDGRLRVCRSQPLERGGVMLVQPVSLALKVPVGIRDVQQVARELSEKRLCRAALVNLSSVCLGELPCRTVEVHTHGLEREDDLVAGHPQLQAGEGERRNLRARHGMIGARLLVTHREVRREDVHLTVLQSQPLGHVHARLAQLVDVGRVHVQDAGVLAVRQAHEAP